MLNIVARRILFYGMIYIMFIMLIALPIYLMNRRRDGHEATKIQFWLMSKGFFFFSVVYELIRLLSLRWHFLEDYTVPAFFLLLAIWAWGSVTRAAWRRRHGGKVLLSIPHPKRNSRDKVHFIACAMIGCICSLTDALLREEARIFSLTLAIWCLVSIPHVLWCMSWKQEFLEKGFFFHGVFRYWEQVRCFHWIEAKPNMLNIGLKSRLSFLTNAIISIPTEDKEVVRKIFAEHKIPIQ